MRDISIAHNTWFEGVAAKDMVIKGLFLTYGFSQKFSYAKCNERPLLLHYRGRLASTQLVIGILTVERFCFRIIFLRVLEIDL